ncbi:Cyclopentanol dehydrogenase [Terrabacter sp. BE26]
MQRLEGRVALVTGAASGIGKATAHRLAEEGAAVLLTDVNESLGAETTEKLRATGARVDFLRHDVASESDWQAAVAKAAEELGRLDILVNNAGMGDLAAIEDTTLADWERTLSSTRRASSSA